MRFSEQGEGACGMSAPGSGLMTVEEFANLTRRTASAVRASIQRGEIRAHKLGTRRWFIRWRDVERMFEEVGRG